MGETYRDKNGTGNVSKVVLDIVSRNSGADRSFTCDAFCPFEYVSSS